MGGDWTPPTPAQQRIQQEAAEPKTPPAPTVNPAHIPGAGQPVPETPTPPAEGDGVEVPELTGEHLAEIRAAEEGFGGNLDTKDGPLGNTPLPATPQEAIQIIETITNEKLRAESERDAAIDECERYFQAHGPAPERNGES